MRRLLFLALLGALAWWLLGRRDRSSPPQVVIGYEDRSSVELDSGTPEYDTLIGLATAAARP